MKILICDFRGKFKRMTRDYKLQSKADFFLD